MHRRAVTVLLTCMSAALSLASPASAQDQKPWNTSAEIGAVSDYRFRGISLSTRDPALQGSLTLSHASGAYVGFWGSSIAETAGGAEAEVDLLLGYTAEPTANVSVDVLATYYVYPTDPDINYGEAIGTVSYAFGSAIPKLGVGYAPKQDNLRDAAGARRDNLYLFGGLEYAVAGTPITLSTEAGYETGYFDATSGGGKWDWRVGASVQLSKVSLGVTYIDSDTEVLSARGRNLAGGTVAASALLNF